MSDDARLNALVDKAVGDISFIEYIEAQQKRIEGLNQVLTDEGLEPYKQEPEVDKIPKEIREKIDKLCRDLDADLACIGDMFTQDQIELVEYLEWRFKKHERFCEIYNKLYSKITGEKINIERFRPSDWIYESRSKSYEYDF